MRGRGYGCTGGRIGPPWMAYGVEVEGPVRVVGTPGTYGKATFVVRKVGGSSWYRIAPPWFRGQSARVTWHRSRREALEG